MNETDFASYVDNTPYVVSNHQVTKCMADTFPVAL